MMKTFSIIFLFLFLASCGNGGGGSGSTATTAESNGKEVSENNSPQANSVAPTDAQTFDTNAKLVGFSVNQENKVEKAMELIRKVVASDEFKSKVLNFKYDGKKAYVDNKGLTNRQVYQKILDGAEKMGNTSKNNAMDLELELYMADNVVLGYTMPSTTRIWLNKKFFNNFQPYEVAGNLFHEWLHKLGFGHASSANPSRPSSVPYAIGYIVRDMAKKMD